MVYLAGELKVLEDTHRIDPMGLLGGEVGLEKHTKPKKEKKEPETLVEKHLLWKFFIWWLSGKSRSSSQLYRFRCWLSNRLWFVIWQRKKSLQTQFIQAWNICNKFLQYFILKYQWVLVLKPIYEREHPFHNIICLCWLAEHITFLSFSPTNILVCTKRV